MAIAEAVSPVGSIQGALMTFALYGVLPIVVIGYILGTPARRRARALAEAASEAAPNARRETPGGAPAAAEREPH